MSDAPAIDSTIVRWGGLSLALGGIVNAVFDLASGEHIHGADAVLHGHWALAHQAHFYAALLLLPGVVALWLPQRARAGRLGALALLVALLGTALFAGSGVVTAFVWPVIATHAPALVAGDGPFFAPPLPIIPIGVLTFSLGWMLLGITTARSGTLPRAAGWLLALGALGLALPPRPIGPVPGVVIGAFSLLFALAAAWLGTALGSRRSAMGEAPSRPESSAEGGALTAR